MRIEALVLGVAKVGARTGSVDACGARYVDGLSALDLDHHAPRKR